MFVKTADLDGKQDSGENLFRSKYAGKKKSQNKIFKFSGSHTVTDACLSLQADRDSGQES